MIDESRARLVGIFLVGFAAAFFLTWAYRYSKSRDAAPTQAAAVAPVSDQEVARFLDTVEKGDFAKIKQVGEAVFKKGAPVANPASRFSGYETNSHPPYTVYVFFTKNTDDFARRVLLTLDGNNAVDSFMAEEMRIVE